VAIAAAAPPARQLFLFKKKNDSIAPTTSTANATEPIPMPAFAPVDKELGGIVDEAGLDVEVDVMLLLLVVLVIVLLPVTEAEEVVAEPRSAARTISWDVPQQSVFWSPQHHFADLSVPSQGVISASLLASTSCN
jgi:hypothetical protein